MIYNFSVFPTVELLLMKCWVQLSNKILPVAMSIVFVVLIKSAALGWSNLI